MARSALPQNNQKSAGTLLQDFETFSDFIVSQSATLEANTSQFHTGTKSLKITSASGANRGGRWVITPQSFANARMFRVWVYCHDADPATTTNTIYLYFTSNSGWGRYLIANWSGVSLKPGWNVVSFRKSSFTASGGDSWSNNMVQAKVAIQANSGQTSVISFDSLCVDTEDFSKAIITFDDGRRGVYDNCFPYMASRGIPGTCYVIPAYIDTTDHYMTMEMLDELYAAGWCVANHTYNHADLSLTDAETTTLEISSCDDWLRDNGFLRGIGHCAYPLGNYNDTTLAVMAALGMKTGRGTWSGGMSGDYAALFPYELKCTSAGNPATGVSVAESYAITANRGLSYSTFTHEVDAENWAVAELQALIDGLVKSRLPCVTIDEYWEGLTNPRYRSLPVGRT